MISAIASLRQPVATTGCELATACRSQRPRGCDSLSQQAASRSLQPVAASGLELATTACRSQRPRGCDCLSQPAALSLRQPVAASGLELATACRSQRLRACDSLSRAAAATLGILTDTLQIDPGRSKPWGVPLTPVWWQLARPQLAPWPTATPNFSVAVGQATACGLANCHPKFLGGSWPADWLDRIGWHMAPVPCLPERSIWAISFARF